jgi:putative transposase
MSNHFHLLVQVDQPRRLSAFMAGLLRSYVHYFNRRYGFVGHLWQGRFKSPAIEAEGYLLSCGRYSERNPLEAGLSETPWDYPWSSCRAYALGQPDPLLAANPWYEDLDAQAARRQGRWREFLLGEDPREEKVRQADWAVGEADFRRQQHRGEARPLPRRRGRPLLGPRMGASVPFSSEVSSGEEDT